MNPWRKLLICNCEACAAQGRNWRQDPLRGPWQSSDLRPEMSRGAGLPQSPRLLRNDESEVHGLCAFLETENETLHEPMP